MTLFVGFQQSGAMLDVHLMGAIIYRDLFRGPLCMETCICQNPRSYGSMVDILGDTGCPSSTVTVY